MSGYWDNLRRLWDRPEPEEGRDPVRLDRAYLDLRNGALATRASALGLEPTERLPRVWAVVADLSLGEDFATVVGIADGTSSLYTSVGGAIIGGGAHPPVAEATARLLDTAERAFDELPVVDTVSLPARGNVAFTVLAYDDAHRLEVPEPDAQSDAGTAHDLYRAMHDVIGELRLVDPDPR